MTVAESAALVAARRCLQRGWFPIPVPPGEKGPRIAGWQKLRLIESQLEQHFARNVNLGVLLGEASGGLVDVDLDSAEAVDLAGSLLPPTGAVFGRPGKPRSHRLYYGSPTPKTEKFLDPRLERASDSDERKRATLVELRSTGAQTIFPPSRHPSGEEIAWAGEGEPARAEGPKLRDQVARLAAGALLARHWPAPGARHDAALGLAGGLVGAGWSLADVGHFIRSVSQAAGDEESGDRARAAETTAERVGKGEKVQGWPSLGQLVGHDVVARARRWLGLSSIGSDLPPEATGVLTTPPANGHGGKPPTELPRVYSLKELMAMTFPEPRFAVPGLLPVGLGILAGKPKLGKSWLAFGLILAVGYGGYALGKIPVEKGTCLYLALEDRYKRLQGRASLLVTDGDFPDGVYLNSDWPRMGKGGLEKLDAWLSQNPECRLVIIDTLPKFRRRSEREVRSQYEEDYATGEQLKTVADRHNVCVLVIAHLRKLGADDPFDTVTGTLGLTGAADTVLVLMRERNRADATLWVTGRDVDEQELALKWDTQTMSWGLLGDAERYRLTKERQEIIAVLESADRVWTAKDIAPILGKKREQIATLLWKMHQNNQCKGVGQGQYMALRHLHGSGNPGETGNTEIPETQKRFHVSGISSVSSVSGVSANAQHAPPAVGQYVLAVDPEGGLAVEGACEVLAVETREVPAMPLVGEPPSTTIQVRLRAPDGREFEWPVGLCDLTEPTCVICNQPAFAVLAADGRPYCGLHVPEGDWRPIGGGEAGFREED